MARKPAPKSKKIAQSRKNNRNWRKNMARDKRNSQVKSMVGRYLIIFTLFSFSFMFLFGYFTVKSLSSPFVSAFSSSSADLKAEEVFTVALYSVDDYEANPITVKKLDLMFFDSKSKKIVTYEVPTDLEIDVSGKFTNEPLSKVLALGVSVNKGDLNQGIDMANSSVASLFAFPVDRSIVVDDTLSSDFESFFVQGNPAFAFNIEFLESLNEAMITDLTMAEMYYIYSFTKLLPSDRFIQKTITDSYVSNLDLIDEEVQDLTFDSSVALEKKSIAVLNGTQTPGIASFGARVINNFGGRVISVNNSNQKYEESVLIVDDKSSETTRTILKYFDVNNVKTKSEVTDVYDNEVNRADVVLIIGLDISEGL